MVNISFTVTLIILLSLTSCRMFGKLSRIVSIIEANKFKQPNAGHLIKNIDSKITKNIAQSIPKGNINQLTKLGVPSEVVDAFNDILYSEQALGNTYYFNITKEQGKITEGIGIIELQGEIAKFAYVESYTVGTLIPQEVIKTIRECKHFLWIRKCKNKKVKEKREFHMDEMMNIYDALENKSANLLTNRINDFKKLFNMD